MPPSSLRVCLALTCFLPDFAALTQRAVPPAGGQTHLCHRKSGSSFLEDTAERDLPFSHCWQAFPSREAAVVRLGGEAAPQSFSFMCCAGQEVCVPLPCVHSSEGDFSL